MTLKELLKITRGKLLQGDLKTKIENFSIDTRTLKRGDVFIALKGENFDGYKFLDEATRNGAKGIIVDSLPDFFKKANIFVLKTKNTLEALANIGSFYRDKYKVKVIAITGSNGKTTTKEMIAKILQARFKVLKAPHSFNNQIGVPLTLMNLKPFHQIAVLELGTNHKGEISKLARISKPDIGVITNIGKAHIGYFGSQEKIFQEKKGILKSPKLKSLILNNDDPFLRRIKFKNKITFSIKSPSDFQGKILKQDIKSVLFEIESAEIKLALPGIFNIYNALAAVSTASLFKIPLKEVKKQLENYQTLALRSELFKINKAIIFQDCYNANPDSVTESLKILENFPKRKKIIILGDMLELGRFVKTEHQRIGATINKLKPYLAIFVGEQSKFAFDKINNKKIKKYWLKKPLEAVKILKPFLDKEFVILIKGSRKIQLEKITENLRTKNKD